MPWTETTGQDQRTVWVDRDGIAARMVEAIQAEHHRRTGATLALQRRPDAMRFSRPRGGQQPLPLLIAKVEGKPPLPQRDRCNVS